MSSFFIENIINLCYKTNYLHRKEKHKEANRNINLLKATIAKKASSAFEPSGPLSKLTLTSSPAY
jgi:hypothetical protein